MLNYAPQTTRLMKKIFTIAGRLLNLFLELFFYEYGFFLYRKHEKYGCYDSWGNFKISVIFFFISALLRNCFPCWHHWNGDMMPTLDAALLCSSRVGSDLGRESGLG